MQDECKVYINAYMASNGSCFMVTWTIFKNHLLEVGLTQDRKTMTLRTLAIIDFIFYFLVFYYVWEPAWVETHWNSIWLRARSLMASHYTWGSVTTLHDVGRCVGLSQLHGHGSWLVCEAALTFHQSPCQWYYCYAYGKPQCPGRSFGHIGSWS